MNCIRANQWKYVLSIAVILSVGYGAWFYFQPHLAEVKSALIAFKLFCLQNRWLGYALYSAVLVLILIVGLPAASTIMLLAGVTYGFWEAATLITICRLAVAVAIFYVARSMLERSHSYICYTQPPQVLQKFADHPRLALLLARLAPLPDNVVNFSVASTPMRTTEYMLVSLIGMIPLTLACVWIGNELGSVSKLVRYLN